MSGRSGYRKTTARRHRRAPAEMPDYVLRFALPPMALVSPGRVMSDVTVLEDGTVEVSGQIRDHVIARAALFLDLMVPALPQRWVGRMARAAVPGPTLSGPLRREEAETVEFLVGKKVVIVCGAPLRTIVYAA